jgi:alkylation response protein AidB-like acyl-CoA dehydrogenase
MSNLNINTTSSALAHQQHYASTQINRVWGQPPSDRYEALAEHFRPVFAKIQVDALKRELAHILPFEALAWLKDSGFSKLRLPEQNGGFAATLPELFALLIELAEADSQLAQILRVHFGVTEDVLISQDEAFKQRWLARLCQGDIVGSAWSEGGPASVEYFHSHLWRDAEGQLRLSGKKFYTTGSLFADWIDVGVRDLQQQSASVLIRRDSAGIKIEDDWFGFGQKLTASGSASFSDVLVDEVEVLPDELRFKYSAAFYQLVQLAIITGLGRAASYELSDAVAKRTRNYSHANSALIQNDPQILQVVGQVRSAAYSAGVLVEKVAQSLERCYQAAKTPDSPFEADLNAIAELESAQAQSIISQLLVNSSSQLFDALGASATNINLGLDKYWRNIRTLASHNPRIFKERIIGDFSVNGTLPPYQWRIGVSNNADNSN